MKSFAKICTFILVFTAPLQSFSQWDALHCGSRIYNLDFVNDSTGYVLSLDSIGETHYILKTIDYGESWDTIYSTNAALHFKDLSFPSENVGYISGIGMGYVLKTIDGGETWTEQELSEVWEIGTIEFQNEMVGYGGNSNGFVAYVETVDGGENWTNNFDMGVEDVFILDECEVLIASGGDYYSNENCVPWINTAINHGSGTLSSIEKTSSSTIFMGGLGWDGEVTFNYGIIARSANNGETFEFQEFPYVGTFYDIEFIDSNTGYAVTKSTFDENPLVDYPTVFFKTTDGGETWNYQEFTYYDVCNIGNAHHLSCVSEQICYATGSGGLFRTINGGGELHPMPVGISESTELGKAKIFPNPMENKLTIESEFVLQRIEIYNTVGQKIFSIEGNDKKSIHINTSEYSDGVYIISVETNRGIVNKTLIKN